MRPDLKMPGHAEILHLSMQDGYPHLWVCADQDEPNETRFFHWVPTGGHCDEHDVYVGTVTDPGEVYVMHLFENVRAEARR